MFLKKSKYHLFLTNEDANDDFTKFLFKYCKKIKNKFNKKDEFLKEMDCDFDDMGLVGLGYNLYQFDLTRNIETIAQSFISMNYLELEF